MYNRNKESVDVGNFEPLQTTKQQAIEKVVRDTDLSNLVDQYRLEKENVKRGTSRKKILRDRIVNILRNKAKRQPDGSLVIDEFPNVKAVAYSSYNINQDALRSVLLGKDELKNAKLSVSINFEEDYYTAIKILRNVNTVLEDRAEIVSTIQYPFDKLTKQEKDDISIKTPIGDGYKICVGEEVEE